MHIWAVVNCQSDLSRENGEALRWSIGGLHDEKKKKWYLRIQIVSRVIIIIMKKKLLREEEYMDNGIASCDKQKEIAFYMGSHSCGIMPHHDVKKMDLKSCWCIRDFHEDVRHHDGGQACLKSILEGKKMVRPVSTTTLRRWSETSTYGHVSLHTLWWTLISHLVRKVAMARRHNHGSTLTHVQCLWNLFYQFERCLLAWTLSYFSMREKER